jgi:hypothetical protein
VDHSSGGFQQLVQYASFAKNAEANRHLRKYILRPVNGPASPNFRRQQYSRHKHGRIRHTDEHRPTLYSKSRDERADCIRRVISGTSEEVASSEAGAAHPHNVHAGTSFLARSLSLIIVTAVCGAARHDGDIPPEYGQIFSEISEQLPRRGYVRPVKAVEERNRVRGLRRSHPAAARSIAVVG